MSVLIALMGIILALTVLPALIIEQTTSKGFGDTFFSLPKTNSAAQFEPVQLGLEQMLQQLDEALPASPPFSL